jgi:hypothetical protein
MILLKETCEEFSNTHGLGQKRRSETRLKFALRERSILTIARPADGGTFDVRGVCPPLKWLTLCVAPGGDARRASSAAC